MTNTRCQNNDRKRETAVLVKILCFL